jgi:MFS family permease
MLFRTLHEVGHDERAVQLIDTADTIHIVNNTHLRGTNIVLVPHPSEDVNDPLRWPKWKKYFAFLNVCLLAFMTTGFIGGFAPALYILSLEFNKDLSVAAGLILWPLLVSGLCVSPCICDIFALLGPWPMKRLKNFFWVPSAEYFGKRLVFVIASLMFFCCIIWSAVSTSFQSLLASRVVGAFAGSSTEALGAAIVNVRYSFSSCVGIPLALMSP